MSEASTVLTGSGIQRISRAFQQAREAGYAALMPYFTLGYPDAPTSLEVIEAMAEAGADLIELGVPFSDPLADGPTIQHSTHMALEKGMSVRACLELTAELRRRGVRQPFLLMGYVNPILAYGVERYVADAARSGADGLIVPDLPPEEAETLEAACRDHGLALVYLVSPTSPPERVALVAGRTGGFLYLVSLTGVTGARSELPPGLADFIARVRQVACTPLAVGFGISTPQQARLVGQLADGVIVGSALIEAAGRDGHPAQAAADFIRALKQALHSGG
ncbi:MAG TPA: tryptophan synthase subunit alpha [Anaerolinea thermolimosa]|uniref:Tryptophan synthase alpha chain n=1 Tax=Anaerolinea thermolimosa TaxID=229919 RepID=A0A3D1JF58_9CHLR|nr:tryptophan synthase subunit alpha [Anaerolinea thermolimosa]